MRIEVTDEVGREIHRLSRMFEVTEDALLRRLLKLPEASKTALPRKDAPTSQGPNGLVTREGLTFPLGMKLRKKHKGRQYEATVSQGGIVVEGINGKFTSPSLAGVAITGYPVNGWRFWEYFDEKTQRWHPLHDMRH